jgi:hypothetical protein
MDIIPFVSFIFLAFNFLILHTLPCMTIPSNLNEIIINLIKVDSIWSIVIRAVIWLIFVSIFAIGIGRGKKETRIRTEACFFIGFLILSGITLYLIFGIVPTLTNPPAPKSAIPFS